MERRQLIKGEKVIICKINDSMHYLTLDLAYIDLPEDTFDIDIFLFEQDTSGKLDKKNIIFYNNPESCDGISYHEYYNESDTKKSFDLDLNNLPSNISRLVLGCSVYKRKPDILKSKSAEVTVRVVNKSMQTEMFSYSVPINPADVEAIILGDIYKHNDSWKFSAVGHISDNSLFNLLKASYNLVIME